jgi:hydroxymethylpyrimidine pyrophosphatase-like HAD family hydrolase
VREALSRLQPHRLSREEHYERTWTNGFHLRNPRPDRPARGRGASDVLPGHQNTDVRTSGAHWADVMNLSTNKGTGIRHIQDALGITPAQTMVFGDFLNDLEMMDATEYSFAMHNAHPTPRARARYVAPPNSQNGVVRTISSVLALPWTAWPG